MATLLGKVCGMAIGLSCARGAGDVWLVCVARARACHHISLAREVRARELSHISLLRLGLFSARDVARGGSLTSASREKVVFERAPCMRLRWRQFYELALALAPQLCASARRACARAGLTLSSLVLIRFLYRQFPNARSFAGVEVTRILSEWVAVCAPPSGGRQWRQV